jgi:hypothetical protein
LRLVPAGAVVFEMDAMSADLLAGTMIMSQCDV